MGSVSWNHKSHHIKGNICSCTFFMAGRRFYLYFDEHLYSRWYEHVSLSLKPSYILYCALGTPLVNMIMNSYSRASLIICVMCSVVL